MKEKNDVIIKSKSVVLCTHKLLEKKNLTHNLPDIEVSLSRDEIICYIREVKER